MKPPVEGATEVLDAAAIARILRHLAERIAVNHIGLRDFALVGIPSRGVHVAERLAEELKLLTGWTVESGAIDVSMHRDDLHIGRLHPVAATRLPAALEKKTIILVDDVFDTGRTCRAAMDALFSFGRPAFVEMVALVGLSGQELPIRPDYTGWSLPTGFDQRVFVRFQAVDGVPDGVWLEPA